MTRSTNATILGPLAIVLAGCVVACPPTGAQAPTKTHVRTATRGPFAVGIRPRKITVEITTATLASPDAVGGTSDSFVVRDRHGKELLRRDDAAANGWDIEGDMSVVPDVAPLPGGGAALLIMREFSPSLPNSGVDGQLFGFTVKGNFVPITGIISPYLNSAEASAFHVTRFESDKTSRLVVEVQEHAGNFVVIRHYPIDPEGVSDDTAVALEEQRYEVRIDGKNAAGRRESDGLEPVVTLRSEPTEDAPGQACAFDRSSTIEFIDAIQEKTRWWIHVKIDGREGYVSDGADGFDLYRLGLPDAN